MTQLRFVPSVFAASAVFFVSSLASAIVAPAPGCGTGPACAYGFECTQIGASGGCAPSAPCVAGQACPPPEPCTTTIEYGCVPAHCAQDADCSSGMVCHAWTEPCVTTACACPANSPNCDCAPPPACDPQTVSMCTPRYDLPCKVAADCGAGFTCEEAQNCGCASAGEASPPSAGSGGASSSSSGAAPAPSGGAAGSSADPVPPIDCGCQPSGQMQCMAQDISCQTAAQCPAGWSCQVENIAEPGPACAPGFDCPMLPAPQPAVSKCVPPYYGAQSGGDLEVPSTPTSNTGGGSTSVGTGSPGTAGTTGIPNEGTPQPSSTGDGQAHESSACAMGHAPASSGALALLTMLGALFGLKRRRA